MLTYSANDLISIMDGVQNKIFSRVLEKVIIPHAELAISSPVGLLNPSLIITGKPFITPIERLLRKRTTLLYRPAPFVRNE